ncbi:hypothetical protein NCLIV_045400 [Neospora caninum Liverpool]|uniref:Splicing factor 3A subunit 2 n=1 Tax=Neospora caninum (strain Liverpool) TaxID=572307 RepID=F0VLH9_NEOCL|nr:hypothetical protein NCLIV_045400 [Neospora caninum Liverpool]CBZ54107.1 hypothetical protein NCLIV_045400 [Neospora caninum Liverpool]CEL68806.1 TPA: Splicing factor 3A subunit 2 [Neospora caninum Liverpool]|eukprot:XP_003884138.1 hypothetical protein NCLIV_045400 [Neospora caninum Liverpool]
MSGIDYQNRVGHKTGSGAPATSQEWNLERKERLRRLALETIDLNKDPYFMKNHLGHFECRLCLTLHVNEGSYLAHTQGRKHQTNLARRKEKEKAESAVAPAPAKKALLFEIDYPEINEGAKPYHRFMSSFEQRVESPPDTKYQFLLFAADPYETIAFKIPNMEVDRSEGKFYSNWDPEKKVYTIQLFFARRSVKALPALPQRPTSFLPVTARW